MKDVKLIKVLLLITSLEQPHSLWIQRDLVSAASAH